MIAFATLFKCFDGSNNFNSGSLLKYKSNFNISYNNPISYKSYNTPIIGGCLNTGVFLVSKSPNSFKNLETCIIILNKSSADGW